MSAVPTEHSINPGETYGGGVSAACMRWITLEGNAQISQCAAVNGSGLYFTGSKNNSSYGELYAIGGSVDGDVVLGDTIDGPCTITGSGGTVFNGKVTVTPGSTIESGKFNGEVINNGTITGGMYNGKVTNNGTIIGGTFNGTITGTPALATGSGTENDPYQISTAEGLKWFRDKVNNAKTPDETKICAVLTADIDLNNEEWTPIGPSESSAYTGTFDGQGHTVRNLSITGDVKRAGLFGCVIGGAIRKLTVAGSVSCTVDQGWCGGIAGYAERETIENCASLCTVSYTGKDARVGGIVGYVPSSSSMTIICDCYNIGNITGSSDIGGICGYLGGGGSLRTICKKHGIKDKKQLRNWIKWYNGHKEIKERRAAGTEIYMTKGRKTTEKVRANSRFSSALAFLSSIMLHCSVVAALLP